MSHVGFFETRGGGMEIFDAGQEKLPITHIQKLTALLSSYIPIAFNTYYSTFFALSSKIIMPSPHTVRLSFTGSLGVEFTSIST